LNVSDAPRASLVLAQVKMHTFDVVVADAPLPVRGLNVAPDGTESLVQWAPSGICSCTEKPLMLPVPLFLIVIVPQ
jgi:hypothetical protein